MLCFLIFNGASLVAQKVNVVNGELLFFLLLLLLFCGGFALFLCFFRLFGVVLLVCRLLLLLRLDVFHGRYAGLD